MAEDGKLPGGPAEDVVRLLGDGLLTLADRLRAEPALGADLEPAKEWVLQGLGILEQTLRVGAREWLATLGAETRAELDARLSLLALPELLRAVTALIDGRVPSGSDPPYQAITVRIPAQLIPIGVELARTTSQAGLRALGWQGTRADLARAVLRTLNAVLAARRGTS